MDPQDETSAIAEAINAERALLEHEVRTDRSALERLLDPQFTEIGKSGRLWTRNEMLTAISTLNFNEHWHSSTTAAITTSNMRGCLLAPGVVHLTYVSHVSEQDARRSSIWRATSDGWRIVFHQGTPI